MRSFFLVLFCTVTSSVAASVRPPAVAGAFYPGDARTLRQEVEILLDQVEEDVVPAAAVVVPHAGYVFSGATAARGFAALGRSEVRRVILLGPSHHHAFEGGALPAKGTTAFRTPLGELAVDRAAVEKLRSCPDFKGPAAAHDREHSLEVELPFLQVVAPKAEIVPVLLGYYTDRERCQRMARCLAPLLDEGTVVVASSDFTHHGAGYRWAPFAGEPDLGERLVALGRATAERAADLDPGGFWQQVDVSGDTVCGMRPVAILTELVAHAFDGQGRVVDVTTSGHVMHDWSSAVTYATVVFEGAWRGWKDGKAAPDLGTVSTRQGESLLALARATLRSHLDHDQSLAQWFAEHQGAKPLESRAGAFVTLNNRGERARTHGRLRACMGVIEARTPLVDAVIQSAVSAAHDPRFPEVEAGELALVELEVSVLTPTRRVSGPAEVEVGKHGVVLSKSGRSAVYLPQVAREQGWDRETMLSHLAEKAGLPADAWREGAVLEVFTAQVFAEEE